MQQLKYSGSEVSWGGIDSAVGWWERIASVTMTKWKFDCSLRNSNGEMDATCFASSLGNGLWDWCLPSIMGGHSRSYPSRPSVRDCWTSMGIKQMRWEERGRARGFIVWSNLPVMRTVHGGARRGDRHGVHPYGMDRYIPYKWKPEIAP